jgi:hypothetical protein
VGSVLRPQLLIFVRVQRVKGEWYERLPNRGELGRVVRPSCDHRRRTVGRRPLGRVVSLNSSTVDV